MTRISRHQMFMGIAELAAQRSTCFRRAVGAVIVVDNNIVSIGYNGAPSGEPHCTGKTCPTEGVCTRAIHAERNALSRFSFEYWSPHSVSMYVTESPCPDCAKQLSQVVNRLFFLHLYRLTEGIDILIKANVHVFRMTPSGYVIDYGTGELTEV